MVSLFSAQVEFEAGVALPALEALALRARGAYRGIWSALPRFTGLKSFAFAAPASMDTEAGEAALQVRVYAGWRLGTREPVSTDEAG